jgi:hypothetical protein
MSFALINHKNFDRTTANAGYTGVAIFHMPSALGKTLLAGVYNGNTPMEIEAYLERLFTMTQNIDSSWSENLTLEDGMLTGANSDKEAAPGEGLRSTSVGDRVSLALQTQFSGIKIFEFEVDKFGWKYNGQKDHASLTEEA